MSYVSAMDLKTYISDRARLEALASDIERSIGYIRQIAVRWRGRKPSPDLAKDIERSTNGQVMRWEALPEVYDAPPNHAHARAGTKASVRASQAG